MPFPAHIGTGLIVGAFESWVLDGSDPDALPDRKPMVGLQITITPSVTGGLIRNETDGTLVTIEALKVTTNADGVLGYYEVEGDQGSWHTGVRAVSPQDDQLDPSGWTYRVEIRTAGNARLTDFAITFPPDAIFDLAREAPVPANPGTAVAEWVRVREEVTADVVAAGAAQVALADAARVGAESARDETIVAVSPLQDWSGTVTLSVAEMQSQYLHRRLTGDVTLVLPDVDTLTAWSLSLKLYQDGTGGRSLTITDAAAAYSVPFVLTPGPNSVDVIRVEHDGYDFDAYLSAAALGVPTDWVGV